APTPQRYLDLIVESEKTPVAKDESLGGLLGSFIESAKAVATSFVKSLWGDEYFPPGDTSSENEMSVVQFARICGKRILLT
ncbi:competence protein ComEC, partial [Klebsiella pneumoniae]